MIENLEGVFVVGMVGFRDFYGVIRVQFFYIVGRYFGYGEYSGYQQFKVYMLLDQ